MRDIICSKLFFRVKSSVVRFLLSSDREKIHQCSLTALILILPLLLLFSSYVGTPEAASVEQIADGKEWRYFKGSKEPPEKWKSVKFDDSGWERGRFGIGYGNSRAANTLRDMRGNQSKVNARREVIVRNPSSVTRVTLAVFCSGPFKAYLNGIEVMDYTITQASSGNSAYVQPELLDLTGVAHELIQGKNIIAVECRNNDINSHDFSFIPYFEVIEE